MNPEPDLDQDASWFKYLAVIVNEDTHMNKSMSASHHTLIDSNLERMMHLLFKALTK